MLKPSKVTAVVPTLLSRPELLERCLGSLGDECDVVVCIDRARASAPTERFDRSGVRLAWTGGGAGFAGAAQLGVEAVDADLVLFLNDDAWLKPGAVTALTETVASDPSVAGAAPKVLFESWPEILNSMGTILKPDGWADSRGIGQPDVGQYDRPDRVFGLHFAAALVRRSLFGPGEIGPLDVTYRMYYEDIDWCLRANLRGHKFVAAPDAVVVHGHSTTARDEPFAFRFRLQERNRLWTTAKCFEALHVARAVGRRLAVMAKVWLSRGPLARDALVVVREALAGMRGVWARRVPIQRSRTVRDADVFALSAGERSWFDQHAGPVLDSACLIDSMRRRSGGQGLAEELAVAIAEGDSGRFDRALSRAPAAASAYCTRLRSRGIINS